MVTIGRVSESLSFSRQVVIFSRDGILSVGREAADTFGRGGRNIFILRERTTSTRKWGVAFSRGKRVYFGRMKQVICDMVGGGYV